MTYEELVKTADDAVRLIDTETISEHAAIEFDIEGEGEGAFYFELGEGKAVVEPYEYYDKDCRIRTTADVLKELISGSLDLDTAIASGRLRVEGNTGKIAFLADVLKESVAKKAAKAAKKPVARRTAVKKAVADVTAEEAKETKEVKAPAKRTTKKTAEAEATETKSVEKKAPAKKTVAKKAAAKEESAADTAAEAKPKKTTKKATTKKA